MGPAGISQATGAVCGFGAVTRGCQVVVVVMVVLGAAAAEHTHPVELRSPWHEVQGRAIDVEEMDAG